MRGRDAADEGTVASRIVAELAGNRDFERWREGVLDRRAYASRLDAILDLPESVALNENKRALSARMHWRPGETVSEALHTAAERGMLPSPDYDVDALCEFRERM